MLNRLVLFSTFFIAVHIPFTRAQASFSAPQYYSQVSPASLPVSGKSHAGYVTSFDFPLETLEKGWWKYISDFARVKNRKTYWILTVPPQKGQSNRPVVMYSAVKKTREAATLTLALDASDMDEAAKKEYLGQTRNFLTEFKLKLYRDHIQQLIRQAEKAALKKSREQQRLVAEGLSLRAAIDRERQKTSETLSPRLKSLMAELEKTDAATKRTEKEISRINSQIGGLKSALATYLAKSQN